MGLLRNYYFCPGSQIPANPMLSPNEQILRPLKYINKELRKRKIILGGCKYVIPNPSATGRMRHKVIFKWSLTGLRLVVTREV